MLMVQLKENPGCGVFCNSNSNVLFAFPKNIGIQESNDAEVLTILEASSKG